ncbi:hypothetical protein OTU49_007081, partial [Cherax quadricarinatus]
NSVYNASSHSSPSSYSMQAASKDLSLYSSSAVPFATGPSGVIISSITNSIDTHARDSKLVRIINVDAPKDYLCPPGFKDKNDRESNCVCDCRESRVLERNTNQKDPPLTDSVARKIVDGEKYAVDEVDRVQRPEVSILASSGSGPSLSAPCSPAKPLLRKTEAVDLEEYDYYKKLSRGISKATDN